MGKREKMRIANEKKARDEKHYFSQCVSEAKTKGSLHVNFDQKEAQLFQKQGAQGINFDAYDAIEVEVNGPGADSAQSLGRFQDMSGKIPDFVARNVRLMNYDRPTPIQKHAIPLAIAGQDLMCCAQTGSGKTAAFLLPICAALGWEEGARPADKAACGDIDGLEGWIKTDFAKPNLDYLN